MSEKKSHTKNQKILIALLALITAIAVGVSIWAIWFRETEPTLSPDYAPQVIEPNIQPIEEDNTEKLEAPDGGGAISLTYTTSATIDLSDNQASLQFGNPARSTQDIVLQIVIQDQVIAQSGRITPGNQVLVLDLRDKAAEILKTGGYDGKFVVLAYSPESGEKAMVNTEIPITVTVQE